MAVTVEVENRQRAAALGPTLIKRIIRKILKEERIQHARLSFAFVSDAQIQSLNRKFLRHNYPTDVLAFDFLEQKAVVSRRRPRKILDAEIVISTQTARRNARRFKTSARREMILYVIHGILHLLGYDDHDPRAAKRMREKEKRWMDVVT